MKNVQISQDLFCDLILYHLYNNPSAEESIRRELSRKLDAIICHERFTQYKTAATEAERRSTSNTATKISEPSITNCLTTRWLATTRSKPARIA